MQSENVESQITEDGGLNESKIESILGDPSVEDFENIFSLDKKVV